MTSPTHPHTDVPHIDMKISLLSTVAGAREMMACDQK
jgi:hypothetical protein